MSNNLLLDKVTIPDSPERDASLPRESSRAAALLDRVQQRVNELRARLAPVLNDSTPPEKAEPVPRQTIDAECPLAREMSEYNTMLEDLANQLSHIIGKLEL